MKSVDELFPKGILRPELFMGVVSSVAARYVGINLSEAGQPSGSHFLSGRYGRGEVGEFVLIEGQQNLILGRVTETRLPEKDRQTVKPGFSGNRNLDAIGQIQLLGSVAMDDLAVIAGIEGYPRLGDRVYAAPHQFIAALPQLMEKHDDSCPQITLELGTVDVAHESSISIKPEKLFGRHCAILGATGGGKSWTTASIIESCLNYNSKMILIDATGEYRNYSNDSIIHCRLGDPVDFADNSIPCSLPPNSFMESDFVALFEPAGKVQGPMLRAAIKSLRLAKIKPDLAPDGYIRKINQSKTEFLIAICEDAVSSMLDDPSQPFDASMLANQIEQECVYTDGFLRGGARGEKDPTKWGDSDGNFSYCLSLIARINAVLNSTAFECVFRGEEPSQLTDKIDLFIESDKKLLRICLSGVAAEYNAREIIANVIGRYVLNKARERAFVNSPLVVIVDEAHNFLGQKIGGEDYAAKLDAFEIIAKEGRKYGLNICLATQRPRDITEGVLSQIGTLIVHRLTNDRDREVVERACGEIDRAASAFLPNLQPGEAAIIGTDFPIPLTIQIKPPKTKPESGGPNYQKNWGE